mmetsp:Transcript_20883/g.51693  ORF Transcript_20883/g.51693 Transcript_20883/m.51693 type:complete len:85 (-) Transcript_20883:400-654(-)
MPVRNNRSPHPATLLICFVNEEKNVNTRANRESEQQCRRIVYAIDGGANGWHCVHSDLTLCPTFGGCFDGTGADIIVMVILRVY